MWWHGRGNSGGSWLPEEKKANMWYRRGNSGGSWLPAFPRSTECCILKYWISRTYTLISTKLWIIEIYINNDFVFLKNEGMRVNKEIHKYIILQQSKCAN